MSLNGKPILARNLLTALPSPTTDLYTMLRRLGARGDQLAREFISQVIAEETAAVKEGRKMGRLKLVII